MHSFAWHMPIDIRFGSGVSQRIPSDLNGRPCVVMAFDQAFELGLQQGWAKLLGGGLLGWLPVPQGPATMDGARRLAQRLWPLLQAHPDAVLVGLGGGATMDLAKLLRAQPEGHRFDKLTAALSNDASWPLRCRAELWLVPTTAGTGKEVLRWATLADGQGAEVQTQVVDEGLAWAERAYVDPWLTSTCPADATRRAALQALANGLAALWSPPCDPLNHTLALEAVRQVITNLPPLLQDPHDLPLRSQLCRASMNAGMALPRRIGHLPDAASLPLRWAHAQGMSRPVDELLQNLLGCTLLHGPARLASWLRGLGAEVHPESDAMVGVEPLPVPSGRTTRSLIAPTRVRPVTAATPPAWSSAG